MNEKARKGKSYAQRISDIRKLYRLSQEALASLLKISSQSISNYENSVTVPEPWVCIKLALIAPSQETTDFFLELAGLSKSEIEALITSVWEHVGPRDFWVRDHLEKMAGRFGLNKWSTLEFEYYSSDGRLVYAPATPEEEAMSARALEILRSENSVASEALKNLISSLHQTLFPKGGGSK